MLTGLLSVLGITPKKASAESRLQGDVSSEAYSYVIPHSPRAMEIVVKQFIDIELDVVGWYALGHYHPRDFISAVAQQEKHYDLTEQQVEQAWVKFKNSRGEYFDTPVSDAEPITLLMLWD